METALYRTAVLSPAHGEKSAVGTHQCQQSRWLRPCGHRCRALSGPCAALDLGMSLACDPPGYQADFVHSAGLQRGGWDLKATAFTRLASQDGPTRRTGLHFRKSQRMRVRTKLKSKHAAIGKWKLKLPFV